MTRRDALALLLSTTSPVWAMPRPEGPRGIVYLVEGIGGLPFLEVTSALGLARLPHELRPYYWSHGLFRFLADLRDVEHSRKRGTELAREIVTFRCREPQRPVYLLAQSGGTAVAARAAECLAPDSLERIVFLASALSAEYDLRGALAASRGGLISYHSRLDCLFLGASTRLFGTADGKRTEGAGLRGFRMPACLTPEERALYEQRLVQIPWTPRDLALGNLGCHNCPLAPPFLAIEVARWLR